MARQKTLYSLLDVKKKTGISYPTLVKYAKEFADQIPAVGTGRNRRYTVESIKVFQRLFAKRRPGRRPGAGWVKHPPGSVARLPEAQGGPTPGQSSPLRQEAPLRLAEEDRELIRNLREALREHSSKMDVWLTALGVELLR